MPLESATFISGLVPANPIHTDGLSQADSHMRLIKSTLLATFPALTGAVTASQSDLNFTTGLPAALALKAALAGATFTGPVSATSIRQGGNVLIPTGFIGLWSGSAAAIPAGWALCDGTLGTPNLVGSFLVGAGVSGTTTGSTGGANTRTVTTDTVPGHSHGGLTFGAGAQVMTATAAAYALTIADIPSHTHGVTDPGHAHALPAGTTLVSGPGGAGVLSTATGQSTSAAVTGISIQAQGGGGGHTHTITVSSVLAHQHGLNVDGSHSHAVTFDNRPLWFALCFIMKL